MAFSQKTGGFAANTSTGNQSVTGLGFQPKAIIFYASNLTAIGSGANIGNSFGMATSSTDRYCVSQSALDGQGTANTDIRHDDTKCLSIINSTPAVIFAIDFVSMDADGFTVNITTTDASARLINYIALGGSDLTNVDLNLFQSAAGTGNQSVTGLGFQPDALVVLSGIFITTPPVMAGSNASVNFGFATSSNQGQSFILIGNGNNPQEDEKIQKSTTIVSASNKAGALSLEGSLTSLDSDGYTINWTTAAQRWICILALKGGRYKVGTFNQPAATGGQAVTGVGFQPVGLLMSSINNTTSTSILNASATLSIGSGESSSSRRSYWIGDRNNISPTQSDTNLDNTKIIKTLAPGTPTVTSAADLTTLDADGFTLNWTTADATAREVLYMAMGDTVSAAFKIFGDEQLVS